MLRMCEHWKQREPQHDDTITKQYKQPSDISKAAMVGYIWELLNQARAIKAPDRLTDKSTKPKDSYSFPKLHEHADTILVLYDQHPWAFQRFWWRSPRCQ